MAKKQFKVFDKRKVRFTIGMSQESQIIITDAPPEEIIAWCKRYNEEMDCGNKIEPYDSLKTQYYVKELFDSDIDPLSNVDIIGYDESYDLMDYC